MQNNKENYFSIKIKSTNLKFRAMLVLKNLNKFLTKINFFRIYNITI